MAPHGRGWAGRHALDADASTRSHQAFFAGVVLLVVGILWLMAMA